VVAEFGEAALPLFDDLTTDPKRNPRPKPAEIVLGFKPDFDQLVAKAEGLSEEQRQALIALHQKAELARSDCEQARKQREAFARLSFVLVLLHYYGHQNTEAPDVVFAQRLPALVEQLALSGCKDTLDEQRVADAEALLAHIVSPDHRQMLVNNLGKRGGLARTLRYVLTFRSEKIPDLDHALADFVRHLVPAEPEPLPQAAQIAATLRLVPQDMQRLITGAIMSSDRRRREELVNLAQAVGKELGMEDIEASVKSRADLPPETERRMVWEDIREHIRKRDDPATVASMIRERLHARYDEDEVRESWLALIEADPISFIRIFCQLPYLPNGKTDPVAHTVMQIHLTRLLHPKYASSYQKIVTSLKNMYQANPNSTTLQNFMAMVKWADPAAAEKISADVGMAQA